MMHVETATFETLAEPPIPEWIIRVTATGSDFAHRALPIQARVGEIVAEGLILGDGGTGFIGYLTEPPPDGAHLFVGYADQELTDTGITFHNDIV